MYINKFIQPLVIQEYIKLASDPKYKVSFAAGLPDIQVLPINKLKEAYQSLSGYSDNYFQYTSPISMLKKKL